MEYCLIIVRHRANFCCFVKHTQINIKIKESCLTKWSKVFSSGMKLNSGATLNSLTFSMESHWLVPITAILQGVCFLNQSLKISAPQLNPNSKFSKCPDDFWPSFFFKQKFSNGKFDALRGSFDQRLISPNMSRDMLKPVFFQFYLEKTLTIVHCHPTWR